MGVTAAVVSAVAAVGGATAGVVQGNKARKQQARATDQARADALKPGPQLARSPNQRAALPGTPGGPAPTPGSSNNTLLTGASGVDSSALNLGKTTLLGG